MQRRLHETAIRGLLAFMAAGLMLAGGIAGAQQDVASAAPRYGAANPPPFEVADADGNGVIEPHEVGLVGVPFTLLDRDGNGYVSRAEYMSGTAQYAMPETDTLNPGQQASK